MPNLQSNIVTVDELVALNEYIEFRHASSIDQPLVPPVWHEYGIDYTTYFLERLKEIWEQEKDERRVFGPLDSNWTQLKQKCPACRQKFKIGDFIVLAILGPGINSESRAKAREGKAYNAIALPMHNACRYGDEDNYRS